MILQIDSLYTAMTVRAIYRTTLVNSNWASESVRLRTVIPYRLCYRRCASNYRFLARSSARGISCVTAKNRKKIKTSIENRQQFRCRFAQKGRCDIGTKVVRPRESRERSGIEKENEGGKLPFCLAFAMISGWSPEWA